MNEKYDQEKFFYSTLSKLESNLTRFIFETNFTNVPSIYLREEVSKLKKKSFKRSISQNQIQPHYTKIRQKIFPLINNKRDPSARNRNSSIFKPLIKNKNIISGKPDINNILEKVPLRKEIKDFSNKGYLKYSNEKRNNQLYHTQLFDKSMNTIIRNKDIQKGLFDMINKGLIPKCSDVTPAFNRDGNPFSITATNFHNFKRKFNKNEITNATINKLRYRPDYDLEVFYKTFQPYKKIEINKNSKIFKNKELLTSSETNKSTITEKKETRQKNDENNVLVENIKITSRNIENLNQKKIVPSNKYQKIYPPNLISDSNQKNFYDYIRNMDLSNSIPIKFINFKLISDEKVEQFKKENIYNWNNIENILGNFSILLEKLDINN